MLLSNRSYIRSNCKQRPSCAAGVNVRAQHVLHGSCATQHRAFEALQSATPTCIATLIETVPQFKALTAASDLHSGQTVLLLPPCNSLCVPVNGPIYSWERDWLEPFEASHGPLPAALYHYLTEQAIPPVMRLAALLLYIKNTVGGSSSDFWSSWLQLLPPLSAATHGGAGWSAAEIQQLQFQPAKAVVASEAQAWADMRMLMLDYLNISGLDKLHLADNEQLVSWALFIAQTRSAADDHTMRIIPIHDLLNHSDTPNCNPFNSSSGYVVKASEEISAGTELTIIYTLPDEVCNLELLVAWGFTTSTRLLDCALPQVIHLLPPISYQAVLAAAVEIAPSDVKLAAAAAAAMGEEADAGSLAVYASGIRDYLVQLVVAASSLPLAIDSHSSTTAGAELYCHAAQLLDQLGLSQLQQQDDSMSVLPGAEWSTSFRHPNDRHATAGQENFVLDYLKAATAAAVEISRSQSAQQDWQQHQQKRTDRPPRQYVTPSLELQQMSAAAVHHQCQLLLLKSGTSVQQDETLLAQLKQQHLCSGLSPATPAACQPADAKAAVGRKQLRRQVRRFGPLGLPATPPQPPAVEAEAMDGMQQSWQQSITAADSRHQELLEQFEQLQQQVVQQLMLLEACHVMNAVQTSGESSILDRRTVARHAAHEAKKAAAAKVVSILAPKFAAGQYSVQQLRQQQGAAKQISQMQQQQLELLKQLHQQQQQVTHGHQAASAAGSGEECADSQVLADPAVNRARLLAAVSYRLEQKKLMQLCAELARRVQLQPKSDQGADNL